jgi:hypothetical protein
MVVRDRQENLCVCIFDCSFFFLSCIYIPRAFISLLLTTANQLVTESFLFGCGVAYLFIYVRTEKELGSPP